MPAANLIIAAASSMVRAFIPGLVPLRIAATLSEIWFAGSKSLEKPVFQMIESCCKS